MSQGRAPTVLGPEVMWQEVDLSPSSEIFDSVAWDIPQDLQAGVTASLGNRIGTPGFTQHLSAWMPRAAQRRPGAAEPRTIQVGIGLIVAAGEAVATPLPGTVVGLDSAGVITIAHEGTAPAGANGKIWTRWFGLATSNIIGSVLKVGDTVGTVVGWDDQTSGVGPIVFIQALTDQETALGDARVFISPSERTAWSEKCIDPAVLLGIVTQFAPEQKLTGDQVLAVRDQRLARSQRAYFKRPPNLVRSRGVWFYDEDALGYLDVINNVSHVGHAEPRVVAAATRQLSRLNTNSRFMYEGIASYAARIVETLPKPLEVVFFVCTGSEANDLALRISRQITGREDVAVIDGAYHGNTTAVMGVSPNRYKGRGGRGTPATTHELETPDRFRGSYRYDDEDAGLKYAADAEALFKSLAAEGRPPAAFIAESLMGTAGNIVLPPGYLKATFEAARAVGAFCISDEVQVGVGRFGSHFWGFEAQGVVPDIVTMGKPLGNGHPIAALVTTREIADAFDDGVKYFNTFAGNPASCAIGTAVLDIVQGDGLQGRALEVGNYLISELTALRELHPMIGDVRGHGLYMGVELVTDPLLRTPATDQAKEICEILKDNGVFNYPTGKYDNVLKIKPPMVFGKEHADIFVSTLGAALTQIESR